MSLWGTPFVYISLYSCAESNCERVTTAFLCTRSDCWHAGESVLGTVFCRRTCLSELASSDLKSVWAQRDIYLSKRICVGVRKQILGMLANHNPEAGSFQEPFSRRTCSFCWVGLPCLSRVCTRRARACRMSHVASPLFGISLPKQGGALFPEFGVFIHSFHLLTGDPADEDNSE